MKCDKINLCVSNILFELQRGYSSIPKEYLNKPMVLKYNTKTHEFYKVAYGLQYGLSLPKDLNYLGIRIEIDETYGDNYYTIELDI